MTSLIMLMNYLSLLLMTSLMKCLAVISYMSMTYRLQTLIANINHIHDIFGQPPYLPILSIYILRFTILHKNLVVGPHVQSTNLYSENEKIIDYLILDKGCLCFIRFSYCYYHEKSNT